LDVLFYLQSHFDSLASAFIHRLISPKFIKMAYFTLLFSIYTPASFIRISGKHGAGEALLLFIFSDIGGTTTFESAKFAAFTSILSD
jgi:hypothetical protein